MPKSSNSLGNGLKFGPNVLWCDLGVVAGDVNDVAGTEVGTIGISVDIGRLVRHSD